MRSGRSFTLGLLAIILSVGSLYLYSQVGTVYGGDTGDLASAVVTLGIPHPPGYPLYTFLGVILEKSLPFGKAAWKLGFLSSLSSIFALILLYDLLYYLTGRLLPSFIGVSVLAFVYPFWLYSVVAEVFALNNLFTIALLWLSFRFIKNDKKSYLYLAALTSGLSFSHHHIIIFLFPTLFFLLWKKKDFFSLKYWRRDESGGRKSLFLIVLLFLLGLLPYLYFPIAASFDPSVNWMGRPTILNFFQLVTRAGYGTFRAGSFIAHEPPLRLLGLWAFWDFVFKDFRILGPILFALGFYYLIKHQRVFFIAFIFGLVCYLFFLFYASFPLQENFLVGTFERFVQPLYIFIIFFIAFGLVFVGDTLENFVFRIVGLPKGRIIAQLATSLFFIYPLGLFFINYPKISILKNDFTAENLGRDILNTVPSNSILIVSTDTPLFNTQYVYYTEKKWPQVKLIHLSRLFTREYLLQLRRHCPDLVFGDISESSEDQFQFKSFLDQNYGKFPILSKIAISVEDGVWVPWGLLYRYFKEEDVPADSEILAENEKLWTSYRDPLSGSLASFQNLILSDTLRVYAIARQEAGFWEAKRGFTKEAERHLLSSQRLYPSDLDSYIILAQVYILEEKCQEAQEQIDHVIKKDPDQTGSFYLSAINYAVCFQDSKKAEYFQKMYEEKSKGQETPLKKL